MMMAKRVMVTVPTMLMVMLVMVMMIVMTDVFRGSLLGPITATREYNQQLETSITKDNSNKTKQK